MKKLSRNQLLFYKIISVVITLFLIAFLRYCGAVKLFCSQTGSLFEIIKVAFWAMLIYAFIEFLIPGMADQENIFFGKLAAIVSVPIIATVLLLILPQGFTLSVISVAGAVIIAQVLQHFLAKMQPNCIAILVVTLLFLIFLVCFIVFTYHPLGGFLFKL